MDALGRNGNEPMIDEEIAELVYKNNPLYAPSPDRLRHGRKCLENQGLLIADGTKKTKRGSKSIAWRLTDEGISKNREKENPVQVPQA